MVDKTKIEIMIVILILGVGLFFVLKTKLNQENFSQKEDNSQPSFNENARGEMPKMQDLSQEEIFEITTFFESNPTDLEVESYCQENMINCMYYCTQINSESNFCENIRPSMEDAENRTRFEGDFNRE